MELTKKILSKLIQAVSKSHPDEIGCDECYDQLDTFAQMKLEGKAPEEAMPLVEDHLKRCRDCREEYEALLAAMKNLSNGT